MNNEEMDALALFAPPREGESETSDHTPRTEISGEEESALAAGEQANVLREKEFRALMEGEYKDLFTAYFQETFNRRFKEHKEIKAELERARTVLNAVKESYGKSSEREILDAIRAETGLKNALAEASKPPCAKECDVSPEDADRVRAEAELRVIAHIRARGMRPTENGLCTAGATARATERLTREERAEMARRAANGERITL